MADIVIAAAPADTARANAFAEAFAALGFEATAQPVDDGDPAPKLDAAACVLALWSAHSAAAPGLAIQATLALARNKLICLETGAEAVPALLQAAPRANLAVRNRMEFKRRFEALVGHIEKLTPTDPAADKMPDALVKARAAMGMADARPRVQKRWLVAAAVVIGFFAVGLGARGAFNSLTSRPIWVARTTSATAVEPALVGYGLTEADLERLPWREAAARIDPAAGDRIKAAAREGDPFAQSLACLAHMAGTEGFLPSPTAASEYCDAAVAQNERAAFYLSWMLYRSAPHASIEEAVARERLAEAARRGLTSAQVEYASVLAPSDQVEAGRLWLAAAEAGDARGQFMYARWLRDSPAGPRDPTAAMPYLQRAADAGDVDALHMLATFYRDGVGVARDATRARALYERAAARNFAPSMFNLADLLRGPDRERAVSLYARLACMPDEREISVMAAQRLRAMGRAAAC